MINPYNRSSGWTFPHSLALTDSNHKKPAQNNTPLPILGAGQENTMVDGIKS